MFIFGNEKPYSEIPDEIVIKIFSFLSKDDLKKLNIVNKDWKTFFKIYDKRILKLINEHANNLPFARDEHKQHLELDSQNFNLDKLLRMGNTRQSIKEYLDKAEKENTLEEAEKIYIEALSIANNNLIYFNESSDYEDIVTCLIKLAELCEAKAKNIKVTEIEDQSLIGNQLIKAIMFYNAALTISTKHMKKNIDGNPLMALKTAIKNVEKLFLEKVSNRSFEAESWFVDKHHREIWESIRDEAEKGLQEVDQIEIVGPENYQAFCQRALLIRVTYEKIANQLKEQLIDTVIKECFITLGEPPCEFAFICFGSLAKRLATPYSDIEFGILIEEGRDTQEVRQYFRNISYLLAMKIVNLGQTLIPKDMLQAANGSLIILDDILMSGFQLDLGGKTPLGRKNRDYDLIQTPIKMKEYISDKYLDDDRLLPIELVNFDHLNGNQELVFKFREEVLNYLSEALSDQKRYQIRALKILFEGTNNICGDLNKYQIKVDKYSEEGKLYNTKQEIYRLPSILIEGLALYCGVITSSLWQKVEALSTSNNSTHKFIFKENAANNLNLLISISAEMRLRTYLRHNAQKETLTIFKSFSKDANMDIRGKHIKEVFCLPDKYEPYIGMLFLFYYVAIPLYQTIKEFFQLQGQISSNLIDELKLVEKLENSNDVNQFFVKYDFFDDGDRVRGSVSRRLLLFNKARHHYQKELEYQLAAPHSDNAVIATLYHDLGNIDSYQDEGQLAIENYLKAYSYIDKLYKSESKKAVKRAYIVVMGRILLSMANSMELLGLYNEAEKLIRNVQKSYSNLKVDDADNGSLQLSISNILMKQSKYTEEVRDACQNSVLDIYCAYGREHLYFVKALINLAEYHIYTTNFVEAEKKLLEALQIMRDAISGNMPHYCLVDIYYQLARIKKHQLKYNDSLSYYCIASSMSLDLANDSNSTDDGWSSNFGIILSCIAEIFIHLQKPRDAISCLKEAEKIYFKKSIRNSALANVYNSLANAYELIGDVESSLKYIDLAIPILEQCFGKFNLDVASAYNTKALIYKAMMQPKQAILMWIQAIAVHLVLDSINKNLAIDLINLGDLFQDYGKQFIHLVCECYFLARSILSSGSFESHYLNLINDKLNHLGEQLKTITYDVNIYNWNLFCEQLNLAVQTIDTLSYEIGKKSPHAAKLSHITTYEEAKKEFNWHHLHWEAANGNVKAVEKYVGHTDINIEDNQKRTPLHVAIYYCQLNVVKQLLFHGANPEAKTTTGATPLHMAVASFKGEDEIIRLLLEYQVSTEIRDKRGWTPLYWAVLEGKIKAAKLLVDYGANINTRDEKGYTLLHSAVIDCYHEVTQWLLENKIDTEICDAEGWTALHRAAKSADAPILDLLIKHGANLTSKTKQGFSVFDISQLNDDDAVVEFLSQYMQSEQSRENSLSIAPVTSEDQSKIDVKNESVHQTVSKVDVSIIKSSVSSSFLSVESLQNTQRESLRDEKIVKLKLAKYVPNNFRLGTAIGQGDCFFDTIAQSLNNLMGKEEFSAKSLRLLCDNYVKNPMNADWVKAAIIKDGGNYEQYLARIQFTSDEINLMKQQGGADLGQAEWGNPHIEGRIICQVLQAKHDLNVKLHVIEVHEAPIDGVDIIEQMVDTQSVNTIELLRIEDYDAANFVHLVNYRNHFVPLLEGKIAQIEKPLTQFFEQSQNQIQSIETLDNVSSFEKTLKSYKIS